MGIGECAMLAGLSIDDLPDYEAKLTEVCQNPEHFLKDGSALMNWPSIRFGLEMAYCSLNSQDPFILFENDFTAGVRDIPMNGLVWMGSRVQMEAQVDEKLKAGFRCIKMKIGAINWQDEIDIIQHLRSRYSRDKIEIRVDANGAFSADNVHQRLDELSKYEIHSIEQPVRAGQPELMKELCANSPVPIAFDEELIPVLNSSDRKDLLESTRPQYLVLKPSLLGGFASSEEWISLAQEYKINYWVTSALESNVGLNALAQWVSTLDPGHRYQGLGTGQLYHNNFTSALEVRSGALHYDPQFRWSLNQIWDA